MGEVDGAAWLMDEVVTVRLVDGREVPVPAWAGIDIMLKVLLSEPLETAAGESILFWAQVDPEGEGALIADLVERCRAVVAEADEP